MAEPNEKTPFADFGVKTRHAVKDTCLGKIRSLNSIDGLEIVFLVFALFGTFGVMGITIQRLVVFDKSTADFTFAIVLMINAFFCLYYILSGVFTERPYELCVFAVTSIIVLLYIVVNFYVGRRGPYKLARLIAVSALTPIVFALSLWLAIIYHNSEELVFRTVGANSALQDICRSMFLFFSLLKGDIQICISTAVLIMDSGKHLETVDTILLPLVIVLGFVSFATGFLSVRYEQRWIMKTYLSLWVLMPAYALFLIIKSALDLHSTHDNTPYNEGIVDVTFVAAGALLLIRIVTLFYAIKVYRNFGRGLKERIYENAMEKNFGKGNVQEHAPPKESNSFE